MAEEKQCPLKVISSKQIETDCKPECAWYVLTSDKKPMCAIKMIAEYGH